MVINNTVINNNNIGNVVTVTMKILQTNPDSSFGYVRLLKNVKTEEFLAAKEVKWKSTTSSSKELIESIIHSQLDNKNVIRLFFWRKFGQTLFMYLEYASGGSFGDLKGALAEEDALRYFKQLREGVDFLYSRGVVHRDIKPDNLLLTEDEVLKIADLGLCSIFVWRGVEVPQWGFVGTQHYMAAEIFTGRSYRGPPVDVRKKIFRQEFWNKLEGLSSLSLLKRLPAIDQLERDSNWHQLRRQENKHQ
ncbi:serine/threonine-protein kinase Chk1-like [Oratosquilla oratoria]|uniref:serine/threonine-protein kinase Chk1-like n=1 Tax=Oratosquilla oratoria TaxID=337810 RepID=UPI003F75BD4A